MSRYFELIACSFFMRKYIFNKFFSLLFCSLLFVSCGGKQDPLAIEETTEFSLQGYQFDGTGVKSLDKIILYADRTSHIEGVWANGRSFRYDGKWTVKSMSFHDKIHRGIVFYIDHDNTPAFIDENYNFYFYGARDKNDRDFRIFESFVKYGGGFDRKPDGKVIKLN